MAILRIVMKRPSAHNQVAAKGAGNSHPHAKLVRLARLALADAPHLRSVLGIQLWLAVDDLALGYYADAGTEKVTGGVAGEHDDKTPRK